MEFLDNLSSATKRYAIFAGLLCLGLFAYDCMSGNDGSGPTDPRTRAVRH